MRLRTRGHDSELPIIKYKFNKRNFIVLLLFNYVYFCVLSCIVFILYFVGYCILLYTCANAIFIKFLLAYLLTSVPATRKRCRCVANIPILSTMPLQFMTQFPVILLNDLSLSCSNDGIKPRPLRPSA